jgi:hypothetical protein
MAVPSNILQTVQTYQESGLAYLQNLNCFISKANTKFKDFEKMEANLGDSVGFDLQTRFTTTNSLVANFQPAEQRLHTLTVDQQLSVSYAFTAQQFIFNVEDYMMKFGKSAQEELAAKIEANVALNCVTGPYRFYGDGVTPINSYNQLAQALALFRNYGSAKGMARGFIQDTAYPAIVNSGLNQFAMKRNDEIANSWELGEFSRCEWYQSNLLPIHTAGTAGDSALTLTVVSTTLDANGAVTNILFSVSGAPGVDADMIKEYDKFQFNDGVSGQPNMRFRTFVGHEVAAVPVQFRATADAASTGASQVDVAVYPPLQVNPTNAQNINNAIVAGMTCSVLPSHRAGLIYAGNPLYLAMPRLPEEVPYPTANKSDPDTGVSFRQYFGSVFGQNTRGMIHDCIWGSTLVPEYSMALVFPL